MTTSGGPVDLHAETRYRELNYMSFCINCGAENQETSRFCVACGQVLYQEPKKTSGAKRRNWALSIIVFAFVALGLIAIVVLSSTTGNKNQHPESLSLATAKADFRLNSDAVLMIVGADQRDAAVSQGSGFIISADGLAVTNYHVLEGVADAAAECCNGRKLAVHSIEGADLGKDLVVVQLYDQADNKPNDLPHLNISPSANLAIGEKVIVIGSPQGLENTVSDGILSAIRDYESVSYLQITAPISPGSSGGPVLDEKGEVIGVATFQLKKGQNLNFAVNSKYIDSLRREAFGLSLPQFQSAVAELERQERAKQHSQAAEGVSRSTQPEASSLTGNFRGTVHNVSANTSAEFAILVQDNKGSLSGCMGVVKPLYGSGPLQGSENGSDVSFEVASSLGKITFTGHWAQGSIDGWYDVQHADGSSELGTFSLEKHDAKGPGRNFDTANCPTDDEMNK